MRYYGMVSKDYLHKLIDEMPEAMVAEVLDFAEFISKRARDVQAQKLKAFLADLPEDDEELSDETWERIHAAERDPNRISMNEIKAEFGL
jgi:hypothetical protein